jgi:hypothetical protein
MNLTDEFGLTPFHISLLFLNVESINYFLSNSDNFKLNKKIRIKDNNLHTEFKNYFSCEENSESKYRYLNNITLYDLLLCSKIENRNIEEILKLTKEFMKIGFKYNLNNINYHKKIWKEILYSCHNKSLVNELFALFKKKEIVKKEIIKKEIKIVKEDNNKSIILKKKIDNNILNKINYNIKYISPKSGKRNKNNYNKLYTDNKIILKKDKKKKGPETKKKISKKISPKNSIIRISPKKKKNKKKRIIESGFIITIPQKIITVDSRKKLTKESNNNMKISISLINYINNKEDNNIDTQIDFVYYIQGHDKNKIELVESILNFSKDKNKKSLVNKLCINIGLGSTKNINGEKAVLKQCLYRLEKIKKGTILPYYNEEKLFKNLYPNELEFRIKKVESIGKNGNYNLDKRLIGIEIV